VSNKEEEGDTRCLEQRGGGHDDKIDLQRVLRFDGVGLNREGRGSIYREFGEGRELIWKFELESN